MKYLKEEKCYLFENDDEFYEFAVDPNMKVAYTESGTPYASWDFTNAYKKAVKDGDEFDINDEKSLIKKRGCVTWKTMSRKVENLKDDYGI